MNRIVTLIMSGLLIAAAEMHPAPAAKLGFDSPPQLEYMGMTHPGAPGNLIVVAAMSSTPPASPADR